MRVFLLGLFFIFETEIANGFTFTSPLPWNEMSRTSCGAPSFPGWCTSSLSKCVPRMAFVKGSTDEEDVLNPSEIPPIKQEVPIPVLESMDMRVGRIENAETIPDPDHDLKPSRKYLKLTVNIGIEKRIIVAASRGIYDVEESVGRAVFVACNVPRQTILGVESHGMLLSAANPTRQPIPRTLRTLLCKPGNLPPGSPAAFI